MLLLLGLGRRVRVGGGGLTLTPVLTIHRPGVLISIFPSKMVFPSKPLLFSSDCDSIETAAH